MHDSFREHFQMCCFLLSADNILKVFPFLSGEAFEYQSIRKGRPGWTDHSRSSLWLEGAWISCRHQQRALFSTKKIGRFYTWHTVFHTVTWAVTLLPRKVSGQTFYCINLQKLKTEHKNTPPHNPLPIQISRTSWGSESQPHYKL